MNRKGREGFLSVVGRVCKEPCKRSCRLRALLPAQISTSMEELCPQVVGSMTRIEKIKWHG